MGKIVSMATLQKQLPQFIGELRDGQTHFVVEQGGEPVAVLLNMDKYRVILQMLEAMAAQEYLTPSGEEGFDDEYDDYPPDALTPFPSLQNVPRQPEPRSSKPVRTEPIEEIAAKRGIRIIK